jgi:hypothetical protein
MVRTRRNIVPVAAVPSRKRSVTGTSRHKFLLTDKFDQSAAATRIGLAS